MAESKLTNLLFNKMPFASYAVDIETYEVIYLNNKMKEHMYAPEMEFCWEKIFGQESVCSWCEISKLQQIKKDKEAKSVVEFFDEAANKWIKNFDQLITLPSEQKIKYTIIVDITDQKEVQGSLIKSHAELAIRSKQLKSLNNKLNITLDELNEANEKLTFLAQKDYLTGIDNRRRFFELGAEVFKSYPKEDRELYAVMMDIDKFKLLNDNYGHAGGDEALKMFTRVISDNLNVGDVFGRLGGEEFAILVASDSKQKVIDKVDSLRQKIENSSLQFEQETITFTVSSGVSIQQKDDSSIDFILDRADAALYEAKNTGRNRVNFRV